ncbi:hypothetical protein BC829DRAFT_400652 [Chytridium lagenaria]|nr:hypothetical protein BC829DRAFT_400652 [Chytridium lagenaria]
MHLNTTLLLIALCILSHIQIIASYEVYDDDALVDTTPQFNLFGSSTALDPIPTIDPVPDPTEPDEPSPRPTPSSQRTAYPLPFKTAKKSCSFPEVLATNPTTMALISKLRLARNPTNIFRYSITIDNCACEPVRLYDACMGFNECDEGVQALRAKVEKCFIGMPPPKIHTKTSTTVTVTTDVMTTVQIITATPPSPISTEPNSDLSNVGGVLPSPAPLVFQNVAERGTIGVMGLSAVVGMVVAVALGAFI